MFKVIKRNGKIVDFDITKIEKAILYSMEDINYQDKEFVYELAESILEQIEDLEKDTVEVEEIQDIVVGELYALNRNLGKTYNDYRNMKNSIRTKEKLTGLLSDEFISKYKHLPDPFETDMSCFIFYRTYSRYLPIENRREKWFEVVKRVVEYNCGLAPTTVQEAEMLFDNIYNLRQFPSGRSLWIGGTEVSKNYCMANYNCAFEVIDNFDAFREMFYLLLVGAGVGVRILPDDVAKLPKVRNDINIIDNYYKPVPKNERKEFTELTFLNNTTAKIIIGDSKEGWCDALDLFLKLHYDKFYKKIDTLMICYDHIRPKGERLKTFGGYASGHESVQIMFNKMEKVIKNSNNVFNDRFVKLKPIDCLDFANILGENVVSGGVRRTSEVGLADKDDIEVLQAKTNLYSLVDGKWQVNQDIIHRNMSNNSIFYKKKPSREQLHWQILTMRNNGEPAFVNAEHASKRRPNFNGVNPCFTGDMKLLTSDGFKTFEELDGKAIKVVNINGEIGNGKVWCNGEKETIKLILSNKEVITCTPNHIFMIVNGEECQAKDLKGKKIMPYIANHKIFDEEYIKYGFIQGDGCTGRLNSDTHKGLEVNIGEKDKDILFLFRNDEFAKENDKRIYLQGYNDKLKELGFDGRNLTEREFPNQYNNWSNLQKSSFLQGCYSANGSIIKNHRISYKTTSKKFADKLVQTLNNDFDIQAYITTNKPKTVKFNNGEYLCKESYDINIGKYKSIQKFHNEINFYHLYKKIALRNLLKNKVPYVMNIKENGIKKVYDFSEPITHWGCVENFIVHNCCEILLDDKGMCNLTEIVPVAFVKDGVFDEKGLYNAQRLSARMGYRMTCVDFELHKWDYVNKRDRLTGCSITGWQDFVNLLNLSRDEEIRILSNLKKIAIDATNEIAKELGLNPSILHTTNKPSGTISLLANVSAGVHYSHSEYYIRRVRINAFDPLAQLLKDLGYQWNPENGQTKENAKTIVIDFPMKSPKGKTKYNVSAIEQLENYKMFMKYYADHNVSITVTVKDDEWEEVEQWMWDNWDDVVAVSFLPLDDATYQLMPLEEITEEQYINLVKKTPKFNPTLLSRYEKGEEFELDGSDCSGGVCPIK
jgi:ribonucleotide reductase alpha subunit